MISICMNTILLNIMIKYSPNESLAQLGKCIVIIINFIFIAWIIILTL